MIVIMKCWRFRSQVQVCEINKSARNNTSPFSGELQKQNA